MTGAAPRFQVDARDGAARAGTLVTAHGSVATPAFMPVATYGAVRGVAPDELREAGAEILLANTYHLHERPGEALIAGLGGLHGFAGWQGPWLTDSGGFQVTSLADKARIDEEGVTFTLDPRRRAAPADAGASGRDPTGAGLRHRHGARRVRAAGGRRRCARARPWSARCAGPSAPAAPTQAPHQALFGIVQGGASLPLRRQSARATADLGFEGYAHGGLGLGEEGERRQELVAATHEELPEEAPRYLMGLGRPEDLVDAMACGVDLFDCVLPTRHARHGVLFSHQGLVRMKNARFRDDPAPPDADCDCTTCQRFSRAYLAHLLRAGEALGARLASVHNLRFYLRLMARAREAIRAGRFAALRDEVLRRAGENAR